MTGVKHELLFSSELHGPSRDFCIRNGDCALGRTYQLELFGQTAWGQVIQLSFFAVTSREEFPSEVARSRKPCVVWAQRVQFNFLFWWFIAGCHFYSDCSHDEQGGWCHICQELHSEGIFLGEETETWDQIMLGTSSIQTQNPRFPENKYDRDSVYCQIDQRTWHE